MFHLSTEICEVNEDEQIKILNPPWIEMNFKASKVFLDRPAMSEFSQPHLKKKKSETSSGGYVSSIICYKQMGSINKCLHSK